MDLTLVLPAKDEAESLPALIDDVWAAFAETGIDGDVVVVDDGSSDDTPAVLARLARPGLRVIRFARNRGRAHAMAAGMAGAGGWAVAVMDADGQYEPRDLRALVEALQAGADVANGLRVGRADTAWRRLVSRVYNAVVIRAALGQPHRDANSGLKAIRRDALPALGFDPTGFRRGHRFLLPWAVARGLRVVEVPIRHYPRTGGRSYIRAGREARLTMADLREFRRRTATWEIQPPSVTSGNGPTGARGAAAVGPPGDVPTAAFEKFQPRSVTSGNGPTGARGAAAVGPPGDVRTAAFERHPRA